MSPLPKWIPILLFVTALVGFADASYLTAEHVRGILPPCAISGCDQVLTSRFSSIAGFPVSALGMLYYGTVLVLLIAYFDTANRRLVQWVSWLVSGGMLGTLYFISLQLFVLHAICLYCMLSAVTTITMFAVSVRLVRSN